MQPRIPPLRHPPIGFAHRGARAHARENTLESFRLALRLGATGIESDVWLTADGVPVLDHDGVVRTGLRKTPIRSVTSSDLPAHIPRLAALYAACGADFELSVDVAEPDAFAQVVAVARAAGEGALTRLWVCHHDWRVLATWRPQNDAVRLVDSTRLSRIKEGPERRAAVLADAGIDAVNLHWSDWSGGLVTLFHRFNRYALGWDAQHDRMLDTVLRMGIDGVFSDHVDRMMEAIERAG